jgi:hypothetical protein
VERGGAGISTLRSAGRNAILGCEVSIHPETIRGYLSSCAARESTSNVLLGGRVEHSTSETLWWHLIQAN